MVNVDFDEIEKLQQQGDWEGTAKILCAAAKSVESAGADLLIICTNTMHIVAPQIEAAISIPLLHIADATADQLVADKVKRVGLLGTKFTMEEDFYKSRLVEKYDLEVVVPAQEDRELIHKVIYEELCLGITHDSSRSAYLSIIEKMREQQLDAIILGCTEIALLINQQDTDIQLYDTVKLHARQAVAKATQV
jgi:aspartate racemase